MEDPDYAEKYANGARKSDVLGKLKQAVDARFTEGASGSYISGGLATRGDSGSALAALELGTETYSESWVSGRSALSFVGDGDDIFTGADVGLRLQTPTRLAPFVGVGLFAGFAEETIDADDDFEDNDDDGLVDEYGEQEERISGALASIYPEVGAHFWWHSELRLSGYGRYLITTEGRDSDDWMIGFQLAFIHK